MGQTNPNSTHFSYLKMENYTSFAKVVETTVANNTYKIDNLTGTTKKPYTNTYIAYILLKKY